MSAEHDRCRLNRREFMRAAAAGGAALALPGCLPPSFDDNGLSAATAILRAGYNTALADVIASGFELVPPPDVVGRRVLLKANLVDLPRDGRPITTNPAVIVAAAEAFRRCGAAEVLVGDGSALQRDAWEIADAIGLTPLLREYDLRFIDFNTADITRQPNAGGYLGIEHLYYASPALETDVLVSLPKMKTHHWAGISLSMKNLFGMLSGIVYGWPRNAFHLRNLNNAVLDFNLTRAPDYAIVDGIVGLEADGPIRGTPVEVGAIMMGASAPAVDATAARVMGLAPERVDYLRRAAGLLGPIGESNIEQRGETIASVRTPFAVVDHQATLIV